MPKREDPYLILTLRSPVTYEIADPSNLDQAIGTYHVSALKDYQEPETERNTGFVDPLRKRGHPKKKLSPGSQPRRQRNQRGSLSGISIIKSGRKRNEKIGGSVRCGKTCPAFMTSIREQQQEAIKITVEYQSVHVGREMEVGKLNLHGDDRRNLTALLKAGVPSTKTS
ncbi:uncharacterized protein TNCV_4519161 [Trichonephila clavipes]|nr:uncharacterized protein TNCV_4519161 [Trichonephila clavipes]